MRRFALLVTLSWFSCVETGPSFAGGGTGAVQVLPPEGPTVAQRCAAACDNAVAFCGAMVDATACPAACDEARLGCLEAAGFDCYAARACVPKPVTVPFHAGPYGRAVRDVVGPVSLPTTHGAFSLQGEWTGSEAFVFLAYATSTAPLFNLPLKELLAASPRTAQYVFGWLSDEAGFTAARTRWATELELLPAADRAHWAPRIHFVTQRLDQTPGWVGTLLTERRANPPRYLGNGLTAFAIDRTQRLREVGMLGRLGGSGVVPELAMLANEVKAFDFEAARDARLAAEQNVTVVPLATAQTAHDTLTFDVTLPDPSAFDTLEVDLALDCPNHQNADCGAWDYLSHLHVCDAQPGADGGVDWRCDRELARWITPYWREGRWVTDISAQLATLTGGATRLRWVANGQWDPRTTDYIVSLSLRYSTRARGQRPVSATPLWKGGDWNAQYDAAHLPVELDVPADAKKVELVTLTTGHGGVQPTNCAEFCNHVHRFSVNGTDFVQQFPEAQQPSTCLERVGEGVVPNQHGTWYYGRGGWCPGQDVAPWVVDVTAAVQKGQRNTLTYRTTFNGAPVSANLGNIVLSSWLVVWK